MAKSKQPIPRVSMSKRTMRSLSPFGATDDMLEPVKFQGTAEELNRALEASFKPKPMKVKRKKILKKNSEHRTVMVKGGAVAASGNTRTVRQRFDRNLDGASDVEIERARDKITNVVDVPKHIEQAFARKLKRITKSLTNYFLLEIAPFEAALDAALADASESFRLMTGSQNAEFELGKVEAQLRYLGELKLLDWTCQRLKLPMDIRRMALDDYMGRISAKNQKGRSQELHELQSSAAVQRPKEGRHVDLSAAQLRGLGRSIVDALGRKTKQAGRSE